MTTNPYAGRTYVVQPLAPERPPQAAQSAAEPKHRRRWRPVAPDTLTAVHRAMAAGLVALGTLWAAYVALAFAGPGVVYGLSGVALLASLVTMFCVIEAFEQIDTEQQRQATAGQPCHWCGNTTREGER